MRPVMGWGRPITPIILKLCAITSRSNGSFVTGCGGRWASNDPESAWTFFPGTTPPFGRTLCAACVRYADSLELHGEPEMDLRLRAAIVGG